MEAHFLSEIANDDSATLLTILYNHATKTPDNDFLVEDKGVSLNYRQAYLLTSELLPTRIRHLCTSLRFPHQAKVVLISPNNSLLPLALWALWHLSVSVSPLSINAEPILWTRMIELIDPDFVLTTRNLRNAVVDCMSDFAPSDRPAVIELETLIPEAHTSLSMPSRKSDFIPALHRWLNASYPGESLQSLSLSTPPRVSTRQSVATLFTSSAVDPSSLKCVTYTHAMLVRSGARAIEMLGGASYGDAPKRHLGWLPLSHCFEFCITLCGTVLFTGGTYIFFDGQVSSPGHSASTALSTLLVAAIRYHQPVDAFCAVPAVFAAMVKECTSDDVANLSAMKSLGVGGAPTSEEIFQWAAVQGIPYFDCSGATEAAGTICIRRALVPHMRQFGLQMIPGLTGVLEKERLEDSFGELIVRATHLPSAYDNMDSKAFSYDAETGVTTYRTGDLYAHHTDGKAFCYLRGHPIPPFDLSLPPLSGIKHLGRMDDLVVFSSGTKIEALLLEKTLDAHPDIVRSAVVGNAAGDALLALIQPVNVDGFDQRQGLADAVLQLNDSLPFEKRFSAENVIFVRELPLTTKLTLNRKKVKKILKDSGGRWPNEIAEQSTLMKSQRLRSTRLRMNSEPQYSDDIRRQVVAILSRVFSISAERLYSHNYSFADIPLTSLASVKLAKAIESHFGIAVVSSQLYSIHSVDDLCRLVTATSPLSDVSPTSTIGSGSDLGTTEDDHLVVSGAACHLPGGINSLSAFWSALLDPETYLKRLDKEPPKGRWKSFKFPKDGIPPMAWLDEDAFHNLESFGDFFNLSPSDAEAMSPNARLALQLSYQAIEDAGVSPSSLAGKPWGIFSSVNNSGWRERRAAELDIHDYARTLEGSADDAVGARLSYFLNLTGPAVEVKTACSSSAVAIHYACSAIRSGDCDAAVVVAATTHFHPAGAVFRSSAGITSKTGNCVPFSNGADGFVPSEGAVAIVIQKAGDARCQPYGRIKATHVTQDGRSHGFFAPNPVAQKRLLERALQKAHITPDDIDYFEAHGTGTRIGDAIEMQSVNSVFGGRRTRPLYIGAVKAVVGHNEECAGLTGVLKGLLCFQENAIPPQPNVVHLNEEINFREANTVISRRIATFPKAERSRLIGVSSFGLSGTLAHIVLEDINRTQSPIPESKPSLFLLSANCRRDYAALVQRHYSFLQSAPAVEAGLAQICRTTQIGRDHFRLRRAWYVRDLQGLSNSLQEEMLHPRPSSRSGAPTIGLWFGLPLTSKELAEPSHPLYAREMEFCRGYNWDSRYANFARQLALARTLLALGCRISAVGGEGLGEWVAAVFAEILPETSVFQNAADAPDGQGLHSVRGRMDDIESCLTEFGPDELRLLGQHGAELFTLLGSDAAVREFGEKTGMVLERHTDLSAVAEMHPFLHVVPSMGAVPFVSGHLGEVLGDAATADVHYWLRVQQRAVDAPAAWDALAERCDVVLNIGGVDDITSYLGDRCVSSNGTTFDGLVGRLFESGCNISWEVFAAKGAVTRIPGYHWASEAVV